MDNQNPFENPIVPDINQIIANLVEDTFKKVVDTLAGAVRDRVSKARVKFRHAFTAYLKSAYEKHSKMKTLLYKAEPKYLYDFFECNKLSCNGGKGKTIRADDVNTVLALSHALLIEGMGGIGKSTLMRHFFLNALENTKLIPILIELRGLSSFSGTLEDYIYDTLRWLKISLDKELFEYAMDVGCFLFLFDGFDEVAEARVETLHKEIDMLYNRFGKNYFIITTRPRQDDGQAFQQFSVLSPMPFTKAQAVNYIKKLDYDADIKRRFIKSLKESLYDSQQTFASNPLLLTILLMTFEAFADIPSKLHIFYEQAFDVLYNKHDAAKAGYRREMKCRLAPDDFRAVVAELCFRSYYREMFEFSPEELRTLIQEIKSRRPEWTFASDDFILDLSAAVCLIFKDGLKYRFTHRSFQEYFAAVYIKYLPDDILKKICLNLVRQSVSIVYGEMLYMLFDMATARFERNVVIPILCELESTCTPQTDRVMFYCRLFAPKLLCFCNPHGMIAIPHSHTNFVSFLHQFAFWNRDFPVYNNADLFRVLVEQGFVDQAFQGTFELDLTDILNTPELLSTFKQSWVWSLATYISSLSASLQAKHNDFEREFDELLGISK